MSYRNTSETMAEGAVVVGIFTFWLLCGIGWVANVVKFAGGLAEPLTGLECLRAVGIVAFPIGCVLGWV